MKKYDIETAEIPMAFVEVKKGAKAVWEEILDYTNSRFTL
jgi:hypothetical protein